MIDYAGFDVILGMYQLNAFHVVIDCRRSTVFRISKHSEFEFLSDSKSLELIVYKEMPTGGVLTALEANEKPIPILYEYLDVLPKELTWLPPEMVVKFAIDFFPTTTSISKVPYWMGLAELEEVKKQLEQLKSLGSIQPSTV